MRFVRGGERHGSPRSRVACHHPPDSAHAGTASLSSRDERRQREPSPPVTAITGVTLVTGARAAARCRCGRSSRRPDSRGRRSWGRVSVPAGAAVIDGRGRTVMPRPRRPPHASAGRVGRGIRRHVEFRTVPSTRCGPPASTTILDSGNSMLTQIRQEMRPAVCPGRESLRRTDDRQRRSHVAATPSPLTSFGQVPRP